MSNTSLVERVIASYVPDGPFMVLRTDRLKKIYSRFSLDPTTCDPAVFAVESLAHVLQEGLLELFGHLNVAKEQSVLSVGEGNGAPSRLLAKALGCCILGVDVSSLQIANARETALLHRVNHLVKYVEQNAETLDLGELCFDAAYINESMCHWENKLEALRRIKSHLRPGSRLGINDWTIGSKGGLDNAVQSVPEFERLYKPDIWRQISQGETCDLLSQAGFEVIECEDLTEATDRGLRRRLRTIELVAGRDDAANCAADYYRVMIATHYDYLTYARLIARA
jgi:SAM-dependent methyltransferase